MAERESMKRPTMPRIASYSAKDGRSASAFNSETGGSGPCNGEGTAWAPKAKAAAITALLAGMQSMRPAARTRSRSGIGISADGQEP
jgi:hypothetical protein